jgi:hypothetical protein
MGGCDDGLCATDGLPSAADAPLQRSELAKSATSRQILLHSITSSARSRNDSGMVRPSALAEFGWLLDR